MRTKLADIDPEGYNRGPAECICGPLYHYAGHEEPGQYAPDCPYHGNDEDSDVDQHQ